MNFNGNRRAALQKGAQMALGAAVGGAALNGGAQSGATAAAYAPGLARATADNFVGLAGDGAKLAHDPEWDPHRKLDEQIYSIRQRSHERLQRRLALRQDTAIDEDLAALKSVAPWWRRQIMAERYAAQQTVQQQIEERIRKIREAPSAMFDTLLSELMAEIVS